MLLSAASRSGTHGAGWAAAGGPEKPQLAGDNTAPQVVIAELSIPDVGAEASIGAEGVQRRTGAGMPASLRSSPYAPPAPTAKRTPNPSSPATERGYDGHTNSVAVARNRDEGAESRADPGGAEADGGRTGAGSCQSYIIDGVCV